MKKPSKKYVLRWVVCYTTALIVKSILDSGNAPTITYVLAWIPIFICFMYDFMHIKEKMDK